MGEEKQENEKVTSKPQKKTIKEKYQELKEEHEKFLADYTRMKEELFLAKAAAKESMEMVKNFKMDVDRIKERSEELNAQLTEKITMEVVSKIIPTIDNFEVALNTTSDENIKKGFKMIYDGLIKSLEGLKVKRIEVVAGVFDPNKMEAVYATPTDDPELVGTVSGVVSTGYYYVPTDNVIRYTQVSVFK